MSFQITKATRVGPPGATVPLTRGLMAFVDAADLPLVSGKKWYALKTKNTFYAATNSPMRNRVRGKTVLMHSLILGVPIADHRDRNGLNNRRENLRPASRSLNAANSKRRGASSIFRGVNWDQSRGKWCAFIRLGGKSKNLGRYASEKEAARACFAAAKPVYGDFVYEPI